MYVPEAEEQISHNGIKYDDIPYSEFTKHYLKKINRESVIKKFRKNKRHNADVYANKIKLSALITKEKIIVNSKHIDKQLKDNEENLRSLLENREYDTLANEFKLYCDLQMTANVRRYDFVIPISDRNLSTLLLSLIETGKYYTAGKFLSIRKLNNTPLSEELKEIEEEIRFCRELSIARYDKKSEILVESLINENESKYPELLDIYRSKLWIKDNNAKTVEDFKIIDDLCDESLSIYPFDGEIMAIQARAKLKLGKKEDSKKLYYKAIENTRNGLIWQKVEDETGISRIEIERSLIEES
jgi:hypothetical protein